MEGGFEKQGNSVKEGTASDEKEELQILFVRESANPKRNYDVVSTRMPTEEKLEAIFEKEIKFRKEDHKKAIRALRSVIRSELRAREVKAGTAQVSSSAEEKERKRMRLDQFAIEVRVSERP